MAGSCLVETTSENFKVTTEQRFNPNNEKKGDSNSLIACHHEVSAPQSEQFGGWLEVTGPASTYLACADMIRYAKTPQGNNTLH
jgi:hypothetical protein